jgi:MYXO-CTERM domain-containing protein
MRPTLPTTILLVALPCTALAGSGSGYHPFAPARNGVPTIDLSAEARARARHAGSSERPYIDAAYPVGRSFHELDAIAAQAAAAGEPATPPADLHPQGSVVVPDPVAAGELVDPAVVHAVEDIPGNEYPRKHTLYLNFVGGMLYSGSDNSAESRSSLAQPGMYPSFTGGEATAIAAAQATANDVAQFGIEVVYLERPPKILPYTMVMIGGDWTDTNIEDPAAGVAPGTDCGALGQRHVVYTFASGGWSATAISNVNAQEAGHAWGLDHSVNCNSVMSYCGGGDGIFSDQCDGLCEAQCQGAAGCRLFHEDFCGEGNDQQHEVAELAFLFGGNEPDMEPPFVEIAEPMDGLVVEEGGDVNLRVVVDDNYGGYGWRFLITHEGEVIFDQVDYDREVDDQYRVARNLVNLEPGVYEIMVEIADHFDHVSTDMITFTVEGEVVPADGGLDETGGSGDTADGGTTEGGPFDGTGGASESGVGDESGAGVVDDDEGCACATAPGAGGAGSLFLGLLGLGALRRRRT